VRSPEFKPQSHKKKKKTVLCLHDLITSKGGDDYISTYEFIGIHKHLDQITSSTLNMYITLYSSTSLLMLLFKENNHSFMQNFS
jgi:hypothetical protein